MSFLDIVMFARHKRREMYYWAGTFCCVVGVLLLIIIVMKSVFGEKSILPSFIAGYCAIFATIMSLFQIL